MFRYAVSPGYIETMRIPLRRGRLRLDPVTYLGVIVLLAGVAMMACGVPAWRAARVDPARTLRAE